MELPTMLDLLKVGAHFGHQSSRWHPKMAPFIYGTRSDVHIINLEKTVEALTQATDYVRELVAAGGKIVFVGTKPQAKQIVREAALGCGMPYVTNRWLGGTFTNFTQIRGRVRYFLDLKKKQETGELQKYTKLEQLRFSREIEDLEELFGGISDLERLPTAIFVVDIKHEKTAIMEAEQTNVNIVAICDSNVNPDPVKYVIPGNDDAVKSIELFTRVIADAVKEGKETAASRAKENEAAVVKPLEK
ncbi:MAG: 30S ribosomal protein S2 [bacterium]|nr:30S ribosomal protein S2 [bacterium]